MKYYGITLKYVLLSETPLPEDYERWMDNMCTKYPTIEILNSCYELDSAQRLHYHCIIRGPNRMGFKAIQIKFFHQHIDWLKEDLDVTKWNNYINMEKDKNVEYMFIDDDN